MKLPLGLVLLLSALSAGRADESSGGGTVVAFADPARPGTVHIAESNANVVVHASDRPAVIIRSDIAPARRRPDGMRVLSEATGFDVRQDGNTITIDAGAARSGQPSRLDVAVPPQTSVVVSSYGGSISCSHLSGDVDLRTLSGRINLEDMSGGATVDASNGGVRARFSALRPGHPLSFTALNGEVVLSLPPDAKANLRLRTQNGTVLTDFDEKELVATTLGGSDEEEESLGEAGKAAAAATREAAAAVAEALKAARYGLAESGVDVHLPPLPALPPMTGGKTISGVLHGGGVEIDVTTLNGDITVRKDRKNP